MRFAYLTGQETTKRRNRIVKLFKDGEIDILIASKIFDVGFDAPLIEYLILAGGGKAGHRQKQRVGRGMRSSTGKENLTVVDFLDQGKYLGKHSSEREMAYRSEPAYTVYVMDEEEFENAIH